MVVRILKLLGVTLVIPAVGALVAVLAQVGWLLGASVLAAVVPFLLLALQMGLARWAGHRRSAMAAVFPPLARLTVAVLIGVVVLQTGVAVAAIWIAEATLIHTVHFGLLIALVLAAVGGAAALVRTALSTAQRPHVFAIGTPLTPEVAPRLFHHVRQLATRLGATPPQHIVVGLEPTFYVTSADVHVMGQPQPLTGETLYLSATLARFLTVDELNAIIGHELGHFRGEDTAYSLKFAPVYAALGAAIAGMLDKEGKVAWTALPALYVLGFLFDLFEEAEATVGRERELQADRAGVEVAGPEALALSLMKTALHSGAWDSILENRRALDTEAAGGSLPVAFSRAVGDSFDPARWRERLDEALGETVAHPIDTHPPMRVRLAAVGVLPEDVKVERLLQPERGSGADLIDGLDQIERDLSPIYTEVPDQPFMVPSVLTKVADGAHEPEPV